MNLFILFLKTWIYNISLLHNEALVKQQAGKLKRNRGKKGAEQVNLEER